jgi:hypothetical protein
MNSGLGNKKKKTASHPKPTKSQVRTELHYYLVTFFWLVDDFKMAFKELIYMDFRHYLLANVTEYSENGSDRFRYIGIEYANTKSSAFAKKLDFNSIDGENYVIIIDNLISYSSMNESSF